MFARVGTGVGVAVGTIGAGAPEEPEGEVQLHFAYNVVLLVNVIELPSR